MRLLNWRKSLYSPDWRKALFSSYSPEYLNEFKNFVTFPQSKSVLPGDEELIGWNVTRNFDSLSKTCFFIKFNHFVIQPRKPLDL